MILKLLYDLRHVLSLPTLFLVTLCFKRYMCYKCREISFLAQLIFSFTYFLRHVMRSIMESGKYYISHCTVTSAIWEIGTSVIEPLLSFDPLLHCSCFLPVIFIAILVNLDNHRSSKYEYIQTKSYQILYTKMRTSEIHFFYPSTSLNSYGVSLLTTCGIKRWKGNS